MNRRKFLSLAGTSIAGVALVGCGSKEANPQVVVTKIPNVAGVPPTLAPNATPPNTSGQTGGAAPATGGAATFTLEAHDPYDWSTKKFTIEAGGTVTVKNTGVLPHDFSVDALKIAQPLDAGKTVEVKIPADAKPGDYEYYCNVPGHKAAGMFGTMTVVAKGAGGAAQPAGGAQAGGAATFKLEAHDPYNWSTKKFSIEAGGTVTVKNAGVLPHDFSVDALKITQPLDAGKTYEVKIPADAKPGDYEFYCNVPGHKAAGMFGTMTVVAKGSGGGAAQQPAGGAATQAPAQNEATPPAATGPAGSPVATPSTTGGTLNVPIEAGDNYFKPNAFTIPGNTDVIITITNVGQIPHDFVIDQLKVQSKLVGPGESTTVKINAPAGKYEYYCAQPGHKQLGMYGTMTVEGGPAASPVASPAASPVAGGGGGTSVTLDAKELVFVPNKFTIPANTEVTVTIKNIGVLPHDFVIDQLKIKSELIQPGKETTVKIKAPAGSYEFYCAEPGHKAAGMHGIMTVQ